MLNESAKRESKQLILASNESIVKSHKTIAKNNICSYCKEPGHKRPVCPLYKKENNEKKEESKKTCHETTFISALGVGGSLRPTD